MNCRKVLTPVPLPIKKSLEVLKPKCKACWGQVNFVEYLGHSAACRSELQRLREANLALVTENAELKRLLADKQPARRPDAKPPIPQIPAQVKPKAEPVNAALKSKLDLAAMTIQRAFRRRNKEKMRELYHQKRQQRGKMTMRRAHLEDCKEAAAGADVVLQSLEGGLKRANKKAAIAKYLKAKQRK
mmetsp:Transcript_31408/g.54484  ORF Transcript_31408/g.54484 Transcript_31408/m.54484 type:complete len:187 (-) Transcript_31408:518-1078(-)